MTYIVPNTFIENKDVKLRAIDNLYYLDYSTQKKNDFISFRTTMHCFIVLLEGSKVIHFKDQDFSVEENDVCFLTQNNYFMSERLAINNQYKSLVIYFDDRFIFEFLKKYKIEVTATTEKDIVKVQSLNDKFLKNSIDVLQEYVKQNLDENILKLKIEEIILHSLRTNKMAFLAYLNAIKLSSGSRNKFILESNLDLIQNLNDMCKLVRMSPNQLRNYIKQEYKLSPKVWLDKKRLEQASMMLKNTDKTISQIASDIGYSTVSWFISQFKKHYSITPKEFRYKT